MVNVQKTFNVLSLLFFIPLVSIGAFFLLNLFLVAIKSKFTEEQEANKELKRKRKYILKKLPKEEPEKQQEAKATYKKIHIKNRKIHAIKCQRRDSDNSKAESRHRRNMAILRGDHMEQEELKNSISDISKEQKQKRRHMSAKSLVEENKKMNPLYSINSLQKKPELNAMNNLIDEELSNSESSMVIGEPSTSGLLCKLNNLFYPSNHSAEGVDSLNGCSKAAKN